MSTKPVPADPGRDESVLGWEPVITRPDPMMAEEWEALLEHDLAEDLDPEELQYEDDFLNPDADLTEAELAEIAEAMQARAADAAGAAGVTAGADPAGVARVLAAQAAAASAKRRGPGQPGSQRPLAGESSSSAAGFGTGQLLDVMAACPDLAVLADRAAGDGDSYAGASDDELIGVLCAWDRLEAHMAARKLTAVAELARRRPVLEAPSSGLPDGAAGEDFTADELAHVLAESRYKAHGLLTVAEQLDGKLPGTAGQDGATAGQGSPAHQAGLAPAGFTRGTLTVPLATLLGLADRPGQLSGTPVDPWLARDLAHAAAANPTTSWCVTATDQDGHATWHACARPAPKSSTRHARPTRRGKRGGPGPPGTAAGPDQPGPGFSFTRTSRDGPPGSPGTWTLTVHGKAYLVEFDPLTTESCDHRHEASGHDPGVKLRHLAQIRHATCTGPICRRPASQCDFEHNTPYEAGGRTCLCNAGPKCRHDHRVKQDPRWRVEQRPDGTFAWTTPSGRTYTTEPTRYPI